MIIECVSGLRVNLAHVRCFRVIWRKGKGEREFSGEYADGSVFREEVATSVGEDLEAPDRQLVASPPGYFVLGYWTEGGESVTRDAVLAWEFDRELGFHGAYTAWDYPRGGEQMIACPDGRVVQPGSQIWDTEAAWLKDQQAGAAAKATTKATTAEA